MYIPGERPRSVKSRLEEEMGNLRRIIKYDRATSESLGKIDALVAEIEEPGGMADFLEFNQYLGVAVQQAMSMYEGKLMVLPPQVQLNWFLNTILSEMLSIKFMTMEAMVMSGLLHRELPPEGEEPTGGSALIQ